MKLSKKAAVALSVVAISLAACSKSKKAQEDGSAPIDKGALVEQNAKNNADTLTETFTAIDPQYNFEDRVLTSKIEGLDLDSVWEQAPFAPGLGHVKGAILIKGVEAPVGFFSTAVSKEEVVSGKEIELKFHDTEETKAVVTGPLYGKLKCLDETCRKVAVYVKMINGAGYIFEDSEDGYHIVNSIGPAQSIRGAIEARNRSFKRDN